MGDDIVLNSAITSLSDYFDSMPRDDARKYMGTYRAGEIPEEHAHAAGLTTTQNQ